MATSAQINANRQNALRSTGPRTDAGKAVSRFNALKTGIEAKSLVIPGEDPAQLEALLHEYLDMFHPASPVERFLVESLVHFDWERRRLTRVQGEFLQMDLTERRRHAAAQCGAFETSTAQLLYRRLTAAERSYYRALHELQKIQKLRKEEEAAQAEAEAQAQAQVQTEAEAKANPTAPQTAPAESTLSKGIGFVPEKSNTKPETDPANLALRL